MLPQFLGSRAVFFALGAVAAGVSQLPGVRKKARALAREAIKGGIILKDKLEKLADGVREEFEDLRAEAQSEVDATKPPEQDEKTNNGHG